MAHSMAFIGVYTHHFVLDSRGSRIFIKLKFIKVKYLLAQADSHLNILWGTGWGTKKVLSEGTPNRRSMETISFHSDIFNLSIDRLASIEYRPPDGAPQI